jgi:hypothetical protein
MGREAGADREHEAGQRYRAVFGQGLDWQPLGFVNGSGHFGEAAQVIQ